MSPFPPPRVPNVWRRMQPQVSRPGSARKSANWLPDSRTVNFSYLGFIIPRLSRAVRPEWGPRVEFSKAGGCVIGTVAAQNFQRFSLAGGCFHRHNRTAGL